MGQSETKPQDDTLPTSNEINGDYIALPDTVPELTATPECVAPTFIDDLNIIYRNAARVYAIEWNEYQNNCMLIFNDCVALHVDALKTTVKNAARNRSRWFSYVIDWPFVDVKFDNHHLCELNTKLANAIITKFCQETGFSMKMNAYSPSYYFVDTRVDSNRKLHFHGQLTYK